MELTAAAVAGMLVGALVVWSVSYFMPGVWAKLSNQPPVRVHVEVDPSLIYAGGPNWDGFSYVLPPGVTIEDIGNPPTSICREWRAWIWPKGVYDGWRTELRVTLQGLAESTVLIDGLRVWAVARDTPSGTVAMCPVGGAEASPRAIAVDLDWDPGVVSYTDDGGDPTDKFSFTLAKGEVETFHITATARSAAVKWVADLLLIVDGKREVIQIDDEGGPFRTSGADGLPTQVWSGEAWQVSARE